MSCELEYDLLLECLGGFSDIDLRSLESKVFDRCGGRTVAEVLLPLDLDLRGLGNCSTSASEGTNGLAYCCSWALVCETQLKTLFCVLRKRSYAAGE